MNNNSKVLTINSGNIKINNLTIKNCLGSEAIFNDGELTISNSKFINNSGATGVIRNYDGNLTIINSTLNNNKALSGGIIHNYYGGNAKIINSQFNNNYALTADAIYNNGLLTVKNSTFTDNYGANAGGAIRTFNSLLNNIINCTFNNNTSPSGGAISSLESNLNISKSVFNNNVANYGGAIESNVTDFNITQSSLNNNSAINGGAIYLSNDENYYTEYAKINNNNFTENKAKNGSVLSSSIENVEFYNNTLKGNIVLNNSVDTDTKTLWVGTKGTFEVDQTMEGLIQGYESGFITFGDAMIADMVNSYISRKNTFLNNNPTFTIQEVTTYTSESHQIEIENDEGLKSKNNIIYYTNNTYDIISENMKTDFIKNNTLINKTIKTNTKITVSTVHAIIGNSMTLTAKVTDANNNPVTNGYVIFKLNSITIKDNKKLTGSSNALKVYVNNGVASTTVTADLNMRYAQNLTAVYSGSSTYNASRSNNAKAQISQRNASIVVTSNVKTIKQGQTLTITARVYDTTDGKRSTTLIPYEDEFVYFKVNGITLKDSKGNMQKVKPVNGTATIKYTIPLGLSGVTDGKTFNVKNHTILAGYYNKNYQAEVRNTSTFQVERSNITITITNATVNNKTHKLSLTATIKDYLGNKVLGPNKCVVKVNGATLKNGTQPIYYFASNGVLELKDISIPAYNNYNSIEVVTQDRLSYKSQRNTTNNIKVVGNVKTTSKTYDVSDFDTLHSALTSSQYKDVIVNLKSNIKLKGNTELNTGIKTLNINGNRKSIDGDNKYQFLDIESQANVTIKNIKINNCNSSYGGAIYSVGNLAIKNTTLKNNIAKYYGGAIYNFKGNVTIINSTLNNNIANERGATIENWEGIMTISNSQFSNNIAVVGGAIENRGTLTMTNTTLNNNTAKTDGGANQDGGAIQNSGTLTITNCLLSNNHAYTCGGAISNRYGNSTINNSTLNNNEAEYGGAIFNYEGNISIKNSTLNNNTVSGDEYARGGAIASSGKLTINNSTLNNNQAYDGGAIYYDYADLYINTCTFKNNYALHTGGTVYNSANNSILKNNTFINNRAEFGGAIYNAGNNVNISNSSFTSNIADISGAIDNEGNNLKIIKSRFTNNQAQYAGAIRSLECNNINITDNVFKCNKADDPDSTEVVEMDSSNVTIKNNTGDTTSKYYQTIYLLDMTGTVANNKFIDLN
ncbi:MAG: hypothetical protein BZ136_09510 [Methanosphaera sp. rholeuAM74]|nr:MAG: hypothetical protein BZ136_09510 [Methanosphaera sp. rholeuAM74]